MTNKYVVTPFERIVASLSYFTVGAFGFVYYIIALLMKKHLSYYLRYNILQSVFLSFLFFTLSMVLGFICNLLLMIPLVNVPVSWLILLFNRPFAGSYSLLQLALIALIVYLIFVAIRGKYPRVYWVSRVIESAVK